MKCPLSAHRTSVIEKTARVPSRVQGTTCPVGCRQSNQTHTKRLTISAAESSNASCDMTPITALVPLDHPNILICNSIEIVASKVKK